MLCCVGLLGGASVGQSLGGHWTITAPAIGFGLGLYGDMKFMRGMHGQNPSGKKRKIRYYKAVISIQKRSGGTVVSKLELSRQEFLLWGGSIEKITLCFNAYRS
jgi:hypothetical protein